MKKIAFILCLIFAISMTGCFDIISESTINEDGSGVYTNTTDMSSLMSMMKLMGDEMKELENTSLDSTFSLASFKDSIENISTLEKILIEKATMRIKINFSEENMLTSFCFPYSHQSEMTAVNRILKQVGTTSINKQMKSMLEDMGDKEKTGMTDSTSAIPDLDEYFDFVYENGKMSKKLNQSKYSAISDNSALNNMKEMSQMGSPMKLISIINLPRPARKAEGIGLKLSENKKKITIEATIDDFFESPEKLEYAIEY